MALCGDNRACVAGADAPAILPASLAKLPKLLADRVIRALPEHQRQVRHPPRPGALADLVVASADRSPNIPSLFAKLRWGGLLAVHSSHVRRIRNVIQPLLATGFVVETPPAVLRDGWLPLFSHKVHYLIARKVQLIPPGQVTERFTYQVQLVSHPRGEDGLVVLKEIPSIESLMLRLRKKFPDVQSDILERRARKFIDKIFPTFLTREAGILMILQEHLPNPYNARVPRVINIEKGDRGFVRRLWMTWLRNGGRPLAQMEFAHQSADLLRVIHDTAHVIHMDLRLDNFVITENGVGFVDFGSAVREDENFAHNPLLSGLFEELMRTSQIQRMLFQMSVSGHITSDIILQSHQKADKAIDFFYLAVQFNCPHSNPDLVDLIEYDPSSRDARDLAKLTAEILRPKDPAHPAFRSAKDILHGIERIQLKLDRKN